MEDTLKERFEAIYYGIVGTYPDIYDLETMQSAYNLALSETKLYSAFVHCLLVSGAYTEDSLKDKPSELMIETFYYWVENLPEYPIPTPPQAKD